MDSSLVSLSYDSYVWLKSLHVVSAVLWLWCLVFWGLFFSLWQKTPVVAHDALLRLCRFCAYYLVWPLFFLLALTAIVLVLNYGDWQQEGWVHGKIVAVWLGLVFQTLLFRLHRQVEAGRELFLPLWFGHLTLFPIILFIGIVVLVVVRPF